MPAPLTAGEVQVFDAEITEDIANAMIASAWVRALKIAPCLKTKEWSDEETDEEYEDTQLVKDVLRRVVLRWADTGSGAARSRVAGEYQETYNDYGGGLFRPDEIRDLQQVCTETYDGDPKASTILAGPPDVIGVVQHASTCDIVFGGTLCTCGAELTENGLPLW